MAKIKTYNKISPKGIRPLEEAGYVVGSDINQEDAIILRSHKLEPSSIPNTTLVIGRAGAGVNNIPIDWATNEGIVVLNTPGANANAVKELVLASMLCISRNLIPAGVFSQNLSADEDNIDALVEQKKKQFKGSELKGKKLGVVGLGAIGIMVANAAYELGMSVYGYDPYLSVNRAWSLSRGVQPADNLERLFSQVDFISLHVPYTKQTADFVDAKLLSVINPNACLLNFARGGIVDQKALLDSLDTNKLFHYVTDFPSKSLMSHPKVTSFPHLGASTDEAEDNCAMMISDQIDAFLKYGNIINSVNFPDCNVPLKQGLNRITVINDNVPAVVSNITSIIAQEGLNIVELTNKSKDTLAYTMIDVEGPCSDQLKTLLNNVVGVKKIRFI